tara:strand:+ start:418 stop:819 length:402 start_codon:yes stop_codon:yes gene_type:complete
MEHYKKGKFTGSHMTKSKKSAMVQAMEKTLCNISNSCGYLGISRTTHLRWTKSDNEYKRVIHELKERALDFVEAALMKNIQKGKEASVIFYLKTKGKKRGYIESNHNINTPIVKDGIDEMSEEELTEYINKNT